MAAETPKDAVKSCCLVYCIDSQDQAFQRCIVARGSRAPLASQSGLWCKSDQDFSANLSNFGVDGGPSLRKALGAVRASLVDDSVARLRRGSALNVQILFI